MKAVIMAGGKGTRLQSVAADIPKPMFPILGKPILEYQIESLKNDLQSKEKTHKAEIADMKMTNAIQAAIGNMAQDVGLVAGLLDKSKLILSDDGKLTGLEDQIKGLKESKPFLFKEGETYPNVHDGGEPNGQGGSGSTRDSFASWMEGIMGGK